MNTLRVIEDDLFDKAKQAAIDSLGQYRQSVINAQNTLIMLIKEDLLTSGRSNVKINLDFLSCNKNAKEQVMAVFLDKGFFVRLYERYDGIYDHILVGTSAFDLVV